MAVVKGPWGGWGLGPLAFWHLDFVICQTCIQCISGEKLAWEPGVKLLDPGSAPTREDAQVPSKLRGCEARGTFKSNNLKITKEFTVLKTMQVSKGCSLVIWMHSSIPSCVASIEICMCDYFEQGCLVKSKQINPRLRQQIWNAQCFKYSCSALVQTASPEPSTKRRLKLRRWSLVNTPDLYIGDYQSVRTGNS